MRGSTDRLIGNHYGHHAQHITIGLGQPIKLSRRTVTIYVFHCVQYIIRVPLWEGLLPQTIPNVSKVCALILMGSRLMYDFIVFIAADYICLGSIGRWIVSIIHSLMI